MESTRRQDVSRINCSVHIERNITQSKALFEDDANVGKVNGLVEALKEHVPIRTPSISLDLT